MYIHILPVNIPRTSRNTNMIYISINGMTPPHQPMIVLREKTSYFYKPTYISDKKRNKYDERCIICQGMNSLKCTQI